MITMDTGMIRQTDGTQTLVIERDVNIKENDVG